MKRKIYFLGIALFVFGLHTMVAQNLNDIQRGQRGYSPPPLDREQGGIAIDNTLEDIDEKMDLYQQEFSLDAFEKAVLKNYIVDFETEKMSLLENETISYDVKQQSLLKLNDKLSTTLATLFTEEELTKFQILHFQEGSKKKKRRKKNRD